MLCPSLLLCGVTEVYFYENGNEKRMAAALGIKEYNFSLTQLHSVVFMAGSFNGFVGLEPET